MSQRQLRSSNLKVDEPTSTPIPIYMLPVEIVSKEQSLSRCVIQAPSNPLPGLSVAETNLLRRKQRKLRLEIASTQADLASLPGHFQRSLASTLIFAQESAGTAVCISPSGLVLTCAHCIAEDQDEFEAFESQWLIFYTGLAVQVKCLIWDPIRDLALLQISRLEADFVPDQQSLPSFSFVPLSLSDLKINSKIYCIGQPGRDDLESVKPRKTQYNLVEISHGRFRGIVSDADPQDNSEIGSLKHDAWTYWGHSGAPLLSVSTGELCGLHSSWDDQTDMRHGVPVIAIREFLGHFADSKSHEVCTEIKALL